VLTLDFETRSEVDLRKTGVYPYAENESTEVLCLAVKEDDQPTRVWVPPAFAQYHQTDLTNEQLNQILQSHDLFVAHNAQFERIIYREIMEQRHGFTPIPLEQWCDTAVMAANFALPRSLGEVCDVLKLPVQKDTGAGRKVMLKMCKPRRPSKNNPAKWHFKREEYDVLIAYCKQDVDAEYALYNALPKLSRSETLLWRLDQQINDRGVQVDIESVCLMIEKINEYIQILLAEMCELTHGQVKSARQVAATLDWLRTRGVNLPNLQRETVAAALQEDVEGRARRVLEIRQALAKSSTSKYEAMKNWSCRDKRARGTLLFRGASRTGRWAGKGIQPQNFPRPSLKDPEDAMAVLTRCTLPVAKMIYGCPMEVASSCLRSVITAAPGMKLMAMDFSSIEARVIAWLAEDAKTLDAFRSGMDVYKVAATGIYGVHYDDVDDNQRSVGKVATLALGYGMGSESFEQDAKSKGVPLSFVECVRIRGAWIDDHPEIRALWKGLSKAAISTVKTGKPHTYGRIRYCMRGNFLQCVLPSGRALSYFSPTVEPGMFGSPTLHFYVVDSFTHKWEQQNAWGGTLAGHVTQATACDLLSDAILRVSDKGFPINMLVHDEAVVETCPDASLDEFQRIFAEVPFWAEGCPIEAEGWEGLRYRK